jgi:hypothetical protein
MLRGLLDARKTALATGYSLSLLFESDRRAGQCVRRARDVDQVGAHQC